MTPGPTIPRAGPFPDRWERTERLLVLLIALHSAAVGTALAFFPKEAVALAGWGEAFPLFFVRQAGVFHFILAFGYLLEHGRYGGVRLLVGAKAAAFVFLTAVSAAGGVPWAVPFSGAADGLMGAAVLLVRRLAGAAGASRAGVPPRPAPRDPHHAGSPGVPPGR